MNGLVVGSGETTATCPRLSGFSTHADSVKPCAGAGSRPSCAYIAETMWNCTSGAARPVARAQEAAALGGVGGQRAAALGRPQREVLLGERVLEAHRLLEHPGEAGRRVVLEAEPDAGDLGHGGHLQQRQLVGAPDSRQPQDLRRQVGARRDDDLALGAELEHLAQPRAGHPDRAGAVEQHAVHVHVGLDGEVRAVHDRVQVGDRRAAAAAVARGQLVPAHAVLAGPVEVLAGRQAARGRGVEEGLREAGARQRVRHAQRPADAVVLGGAARVVLRAQEVGQHVVPAPAEL